MRFDPAVANADLWPEAWYSAVTESAIESKSKKSGNPMMVVTFKCFDAGKPPITIDRYFVTNNKTGMGGLKKLCAALGLIDRFNAGELTPDELKGRNLKVLVKIQEDETGRWDDKNVAAAFVAESENPPTADGDEIPF